MAKTTVETLRELGMECHETVDGEIVCTDSNTQLIFNPKTDPSYPEIAHYARTGEVPEKNASSGWLVSIISKLLNK